MLKWCFATRLNQCFSTSRPRPTGGPQSSFWWAGTHFLFGYNCNCIHRLHKIYKKLTISATTVSRNKQISKETKKVQQVYSGPPKCIALLPTLRTTGLNQTHGQNRETFAEQMQNCTHFYLWVVVGRSSSSTKTVAKKLPKRIFRASTDVLDLQIREKGKNPNQNFSCIFHYFLFQNRFWYIACQKTVSH